MKNYRAAGGLLFFSYGPFLAFWDFSCLSWYTNDKLRMENVDWKKEGRIMTPLVQKALCLHGGDRIGSIY